MPRGGWVGKQNTPALTSASGVWTVEDVFGGRGTNSWPSMNPYSSGSIARYLRDMSASGNETWSLTSGATVDVEKTILSGDQTLAVNTNWGDSTPDTRAVAVQVNGNLTINSGVTLTTQTRKRGLYILVRGDCTINGTLTMTARGANAAPPSSDLTIIEGFSIPATGGAASGSSANAAGLLGGKATAGQTGGGAGGGGHNNGANSSGAAGTAWSGGAGGGGTGSPAGTNGGANGGAGGAGGAGDAFGRGGGGGGAGNPGGAGGAAGSGASAAAGGTGTSGTGGTIILLVEGTLSVGSAGVISSNGSAGGNAPGTNAASGGGGSGAGSVNIFHGGLSMASGAKIQAYGGNGGVPGAQYMNGASVGGRGGDGWMRHFRINKGNTSYTSIYDALTKISTGYGDMVKINGLPLPMEATVLSGTTLSSSTTWGNTEPDAFTLVRVEGSLTVNGGVSLTTSVRKRGLAILIQGDLTLNGTLHMNGRAGWGEDLSGPLVLYLGTTVTAGASGGMGGAPRHDTTNGGGTVGSGGGAAAAGTGLAGGGGGGGTGGCSYANAWIGQGGTGGAGRMWGGGAGGGGSGYGHNGSSTQTQIQDYEYNSGNRYHSEYGHRAFTDGRGGWGGRAYHDGTHAHQHPYLGATTGYYMGGNGNGVLDSTGPGGMIYLFVLGNVTVGASGAIQATGSQGNTGTTGSGSNGSGGGSGGGACTILYTGSYSNSGSTNFGGGTGGSVLSPGYGGGLGGVGGTGGTGSLRAASFAG